MPQQAEQHTTRIQEVARDIGFRIIDLHEQHIGHDWSPAAASLTSLLIGRESFQNAPAESKYLGSIPATAAELQYAAASLAYHNREQETGGEKHPLTNVIPFFHDQALQSVQKDDLRLSRPDADLRVHSVPVTAHGIYTALRTQNTENPLNSMTREWIGSLQKKIQSGLLILTFDAPHDESIPPEKSPADAMKRSILLLEPEAAYIDFLASRHAPGGRENVAGGFNWQRIEVHKFKQLVEAIGRETTLESEQIKVRAATLAITYRMFEEAWSMLEEANVPTDMITVTGVKFMQGIFESISKQIAELL